MTNPFLKKLAAKPDESVTLTGEGKSEIPAPAKSALAQRFAPKPAATPAPAMAASGRAEISQDIDVDFNLDDLSNLEDEGIAPDPDEATLLSAMGQFSDETPATAPTRELPEDMSKGMTQFVDLIDQVYGIVHDPELLGNVCRSIMIELKANPAYMKLVTQTDVRTWVQAMRNDMGLARVKKLETKTKRSSGGSAKSGKGIDSDMAQAFDDLGLDLDNL